MIAVDTNILVAAHRTEYDIHNRALKSLTSLITSKSSWAIPWPCIHEFVAIVTNPKIFKKPSPIKTSFEFLRFCSLASNIHFIGESLDHCTQLEELCIKGEIKGGMVHDARIAAICLANGAHELWTIDRDFSRIPMLKCHNPLID